MEKYLEDIHAILSDPNERDSFLTYAADAMFEENVAFLLAHKAFKHSHSQTQKEARELWKKFGPKGVQHVNITHKMSKDIEESLAGNDNISIETFQAMELEVARLIVAINDYLTKYANWKEQNPPKSDAEEQSNTPHNKSKNKSRRGSPERKGKTSNPSSTFRGSVVFSSGPSSAASSDSSLSSMSLDLEMIAMMRPPKLILLGLSESGKTTFLNYCRLSYGDYKYLSDDFFPKLQARCFNDITKLVQRLEEHPVMYFIEDDYALIQEAKGLNSKVAEAVKRILVELDKLKLEDDSGIVSHQDLDTPLLRHCHHLCTVPREPEAFLRNLQSNASVFLSAYNPSTIPTSFKFPYLFSSLDVTEAVSSRPEDWFELLVPFNCMLFFVNCADYNVIEEIASSPIENKLKRALAYWERITSHPTAQSMHFYLCFTKEDLLYRKIKGDPLQKYFDVEKTWKEMLDSAPNANIASQVVIEYLQRLFTRSFRGPDRELLHIVHTNFSAEAPNPFFPLIHRVYMTQIQEQEKESRRLNKSRKPEPLKREVTRSDDSTPSSKPKSGRRTDLLHAALSGASSSSGGEGSERSGKFADSAGGSSSSRSLNAFDLDRGRDREQNVQQSGRRKDRREQGERHSMQFEKTTLGVSTTPVDLTPTLANELLGLGLDPTAKTHDGGVMLNFKTATGSSGGGSSNAKSNAEAEKFALGLSFGDDFGGSDPNVRGLALNFKPQPTTPSPQQSQLSPQNSRATSPERTGDSKFLVPERSESLRDRSLSPLAGPHRNASYTSSSPALTNNTTPVTPAPKPLPTVPTTSSGRLNADGATTPPLSQSQPLPPSNPPLTGGGGILNLATTNLISNMAAANARKVSNKTPPPTGAKNPPERSMPPLPSTSSGGSPTNPLSAGNSLELPLPNGTDGAI